MVAAIFKKTIFIISSGIGVWAIYKIFIEQEHLQGGVLLAYVGLVVVGTWRSLRGVYPERSRGARNDNPSPSATLPADRRPSPTGGEENINPSTELRVSGKNPEEIILTTIREKGRAKREDLLPATSLSRSSLGGLLNETESKELIEQL